MHLGFEDDTAAMQLKVAQIGPLLPPPQRRRRLTALPLPPAAAARLGLIQHNSLS